MYRYRCSGSRLDRAGGRSTWNMFVARAAQTAAAAAYALLSRRCLRKAYRYPKPLSRTTPCGRGNDTAGVQVKPVVRRRLQSRSYYRTWYFHRRISYQRHVVERRENPNFFFSSRSSWGKRVLGRRCLPKKVWPSLQYRMSHAYLRPIKSVSRLNNKHPVMMMVMMVMMVIIGTFCLFYGFVYLHTLTSTVGLLILSSHSQRLRV